MMPRNCTSCRAVFAVCMLVSGIGMLPCGIAAEPASEFENVVKRYRALGWMAENEVDYPRPKFLKEFWIDGKRIELAASSSATVRWYAVGKEEAIAPNEPRTISNELVFEGVPAIFEFVNGEARGPNIMMKKTE